VAGARPGRPPCVRAGIQSAAVGGPPGLPTPPGHGPARRDVEHARTGIRRIRAGTGWIRMNTGRIGVGAGWIGAGVGRARAGTGWIRTGTGWIRMGMGRIGVGAGWIDVGVGRAHVGVGRARIGRRRARQGEHGGDDHHRVARQPAAAPEDAEDPPGGSGICDEAVHHSLVMASSNRKGADRTQIGTRGRPGWITARSHSTTVFVFLRCFAPLFPSHRPPLERLQTGRNPAPAPSPGCPAGHSR
jgi:hypothetical protein